MIRRAQTQLRLQDQDITVSPGLSTIPIVLGELLARDVQSMHMYVDKCTIQVS